MRRFSIFLLIAVCVLVAMLLPGGACAKTTGCSWDAATSIFQSLYKWRPLRKELVLHLSGDLRLVNHTLR